MTAFSTPPRPRWYPITVAALILVVIALVAIQLTGAAAGVQGSDGLIGFLTGLCGTVTVGLVAVTEIGRRHEVELLDAAALDDLEPLRAASRGYSQELRTAAGADEDRA
jgi:hypothetical protein